MTLVETTPFEDLILGSQFLPALATVTTKESGVKAQIGVLQCRRCASSFIQVKEALAHYRLHVFETHKEHFTVVVGGACPLPECPYSAAKTPIIHFHCSYCNFMSAEIMDLPLHMEKRHLAFYSEVSLVLRGDDIQRTKVYTCGECDKEIQGTVSIVQHLLAHEPDNKKSNMSSSMINGNSEHKEEPMLKNGVSKSEINTINNSVIQGTLKRLQNKTSVTHVGSSGEKLSVILDGKILKITQLPNSTSATQPTNTGSVGNEQIHNLITNTQENKNIDKNNVSENNKIYVKDQSELMKSENKNTLSINIVNVESLKNRDQNETNTIEISNVYDKNRLNNIHAVPSVSIGNIIVQPHSSKQDSNTLENGNGHYKSNCVASDDDDSVEINPLELLTTVLEEDQKSDCPMFPAEHFLLSLPGAPTHFLDSDGGTVENSTDGYQDNQNNEDEVHNENISDIPSDILLDHPGVFQCDQCNEAFKYQYLLVSHKRQVHQGHSTQFQCQVCGVEFGVLQELKRHMMTHSGASLYTCQICGQGFGDKPSLKAHLVIHGGPEKPSKCESCNTEFVSKSELTRHIVKYQGTCNPNKSAEGVRCATCGDDLVSLEALKEHRRIAHPTTDPNVSPGVKKGFECDYCGKSFNCRSNLRDHLVVHTGEKPYPCDICGKSFSFIHNMKTHRLTHNEGRSEVCPYCDKAYKSKISLYYHMKKGNCRGLSTKEVPEGYHRCTECLQMFASEERYKHHKEKGVCQMSHRCQHCGLRCSSEDRLKNHLRKGLCIKKENSPSPAAPAPKKRKSAGKEHDKISSEIICDRCNYTKDCCCTFSCNHCGKRVFSIMAYTLHSEKTCPVLKERRERIRMAIMEKRRRKEGLAPLEVKEEVEETVPPDDPSFQSRYKRRRSSEDTIYKNRQIAFDIGLEKLKDKESKTKRTNDLVTPGQLSGEDDDSNSGSLTDLSTLTSANILKSVTEAASVGDH